MKTTGKILKMVGARCLLSINFVKNLTDFTDTDAALSDNFAFELDYHPIATGMRNSTFAYGDRYQLTEQFEINTLDLSYDTIGLFIPEEEGEFGAASSIYRYYDDFNNYHANTCLLCEAVAAHLLPGDNEIMYRQFSVFNPTVDDLSPEAEIKVDNLYKARLETKRLSLVGQAYVPMWMIGRNRHIAKTAHLVRDYYLTYIEKIGVYEGKVQHGDLITLASVSPLTMVKLLLKAVNHEILRALRISVINQPYDKVTTYSNYESLDTNTLIAACGNNVIMTNGTDYCPENVSRMEAMSYVPVTVDRVLYHGGYETLNVTPWRTQRVKWCTARKWHAEDYVAFNSFVGEQLFFNAVAYAAQRIRELRKAAKLGGDR